MNAEIISVGAEVISGDVSNTDASYLSQRLSHLGIRVTRHTAIDDTPENITETLAAAVTRSPIILFTGGLGPTKDDMTKEVVCATVGLKLEENPESMARLLQFFEQRGEPMPEINRKQAMFPKNAIVFPNGVGTADGCAIESGNQCIVMLPGPPAELKAMFEGSVEDYLMTKTDGVIASVTLKVFGMGESKIAEAIAPYLESENPRVATYVGHGDIRIKISCIGEDQAVCDASCHAVEEEICKILGNCVYARENTTLEQTVVNLLLKQNMKIATAESCTAGMLSQMLTDVPGASQVFELGVSAYANRIKREVLGVPDFMLRKFGAVSAQVAEAMAEGATDRGGADLGIGITGIAGPDGGTSAKPVGTVFISLFNGTRFFTRKLNCNPESPREKIRLSAVMNALDMVRLYLLKDPAFLAPATVAKPEEATPEATKAKPEGKTKTKAKWWQSMIPLKSDKPAEKIRKIIMLVCLVVFIGAAGYIGNYFYQSYYTQRQQGDVRDVFHQSEATISERFLELQKTNPDTVGWLTVPGTKCDNPVVKTTDNDKYLDTTFEGKKSKYGTLFADTACRFDKPESAEAGAPQGMSDNTIIYGHHMRDGTMMGELKKLRNYEFYKEHPVLQFTTQYDTQTVNWKILSVFIVNTIQYDSQDTIFNYRYVDFANEYAFNVYLNEIMQRSVINTGVDAVYGDRLLTLSTCTYEFPEARLVVVARRVREGESATVDLTKTGINGDVVYPRAYYKKTGKTGRTQVTSYTGSPTSSSQTASSKPSASKTESSKPTSSWSSPLPSETIGSNPSIVENMWGGTGNSTSSSHETSSTATSSQEVSSQPVPETPDQVE